MKERDDLKAKLERGQRERLNLTHDICASTAWKSAVSGIARALPTLALRRCGG
jgi:hypothetical protein